MYRAASTGVFSAVLVLALSLGAVLVPEALPKWDEPLQHYAVRLITSGSSACEELYLRLLLALPGGAHASVETRTRSGDASDEPATAAKPPPSQDTLKQEVAKDERQINAQQEVSVKRYAQAKREASEKGEEPFVLPEQPDEIRERMPLANPDGPEMRCGQAIPQHSRVTTRNIEISVKSVFQGKHGQQHSWKYIISFKNHGKETVQMLTRHWIFVNSRGKLESEVEGPGARGVTPVLPPGAEWSYESGTSLPTSFGSMYGSFQFEVLKGDTLPFMRSFSGRVGRLLLSSKKNEEREVPCVDPAKAGLLPLSSVLSIERVILGGHAKSTSRGKGNKFTFAYDVQFNNARDAEVEVIGHSWTVVDRSWLLGTPCAYKAS